MKGLGDIYAARQDAADEEAERDERNREEAAEIFEQAYDEAYDSARAGLAAGAPATQALIGELVLEHEDDMAALMQALRHAARGDLPRAGASLAVLLGSLLQRHATLVADLAVIKAEAERRPGLVADAEEPEQEPECRGGWA